MLVAAAVCPCPPLLVPAVAAGAAPELAPLRDACSDAISVLAAARPNRLVVLGPAAAEVAGPYPSGAVGSFRGYGVDLSVRLGPQPAGRQQPPATEPDPATEPGTAADAARGAVAGAGRGVREAPGPELPLSLAIGGWLLERGRWSAAPVDGVGVAESLDVDRCAALGRELALSTDRVALLVTGDGSARRTLKAPGYLDERAAGFDADVARALGTADVEALSALDAGLAHDLLVSGRAPWQVLAGAAAGTNLRGELLYDEAPYGVGYFVAAWS